METLLKKGLAELGLDCSGTPPVVRCSYLQRVEKVFSPRMVQEYTVGPAGFRALCARKPGAFLETGSLSPPLAAHRPFPLLGFPAHTLPYRCGEFTT